MNTPTPATAEDAPLDPRRYGRADLRDISRAETLRAALVHRRPSRSAPLQEQKTANLPSKALVAFGGIALAVLVIAAWHILTAAFDWSEIRDFVAPTAAEARLHGWEALSERAAP